MEIAIVLAALESTYGRMCKKFTEPKPTDSVLTSCICLAVAR